MKGDPLPIGQLSDRLRYCAAAGAIGEGRVNFVDALRALSDDLLESGDARLVLERAFRWGYRDDSGEHVAGLQQHLKELSHRRNRLRQQIEHERFLDAMGPELDRIDDLDEPEVSNGEGGLRSKPPKAVMERIADRLDRGFESPEAQTAFDELMSSLLETAEVSLERRAGDTQGGTPTRHGDYTRREASDGRKYERIITMLFEGGMESAGGGRHVSPRHDHKLLHRRLRPELMAMEEFARLDRALAELRGLGGVVGLPTVIVDRLLLDLPDETSEWLRAWQREVSRWIAPGDAGTARVQMQLPPEVARAIGSDILKGLFRLMDSPLRGNHLSHHPGNAGDAIGESRRWEPGRPLDLDLVSTVFNAVKRDPASALGLGVVLNPEDFAVIERSTPISVSTVLAIDRSRSMGQNGGWSSAKRIGLALHELIRRSYPRDSLDLLAFSARAELLSIDDLPIVPWDQFEHGTNMQEALALSRTALGRRRGGTRQIVLITDGEPTIANLRDDLVFSSPPNARVIDATMAEVVRCTREGITINFVMLAPSSEMQPFIRTIARFNKGRVFQTNTDQLGKFLIEDYLSR